MALSWDELKALNVNPLNKTNIQNSYVRNRVTTQFQTAYGISGKRYLCFSLFVFYTNLFSVRRFITSVQTYIQRTHAKMVSTAVIVVRWVQIPPLAF